jgi:hypothetical protein
MLISRLIRFSPGLHLIELRMIDRANPGERQAGDTRGQFRAVAQPVAPTPAAYRSAGENSGPGQRGSFPTQAAAAPAPPDALMLAILECLGKR